MADKRLGELLLRGWTMLADNCSVCNCPLMRNPDGKKYCVQCEAWVFDNKKREEKKFNELIPISGIQQKKEIPKNNILTQKKETTEKIEKKDNKEKKIENKEKKIENKEKKIENKPKNNNKSTYDGTVLELLDNKLKRLGQSLNEENDIKKSEEIIQLMDKIIALVEHYKKVNS